MPWVLSRYLNGTSSVEWMQDTASTTATTTGCTTTGLDYLTSNATTATSCTHHVSPGGIYWVQLQDGQAQVIGNQQRWLAEQAQMQAQHTQADLQMRQQYNNGYNNGLSSHDVRGAQRVAEVVQAEQNAQRQRQQERQEAEKRARGLLIEHLTDEQCRTLDDHDWFEVRGSHSGKRYRIHVNHITANVDDPEGGVRLCAHIATNIPISDHLLAQKLWLECDEPGFRRAANIHRMA